MNSQDHKDNKQGFCRQHSTNLKTLFISQRYPQYKFLSNQVFMLDIQAGTEACYHKVALTATKLSIRMCIIYLILFNEGKTQRKDIKPVFSSEKPLI